MGEPTQHASSLSCEVRIIRAKNVESSKLSSNINLFVRYYLSTKIQLNTRQISSKSNNDDISWNESFSLECVGRSDQDNMQNLMQETVVFELRYIKNKKPFFGGAKSHVLGRVEVPWKTVLEAPDMELEQWFTIEAAESGHSIESVVDDKPLALKIGMKVRVEVPKMEMEIRKEKRKNWDECGCKDDGCKCADAHVFALAALMDAF